MTEQGLHHGLPVPDFALIFDDSAEVVAAIKAWRLVVDALAEAETLTPVNSRLAENLVTIYAFYDRAAREVGQNGAVLRPKKGSSRAISRVSPHFTAMTKLSSEALALESALGLTPRTRGKVTKRPQPKQRRRSAADEFLGGGNLNKVLSFPKKNGPKPRN